MCTYATTRAGIQGSAKGPGSSWFHVTDATVYFDHPVHAMADHTLNIDLADPRPRPGRARRGRTHRRLGPGADRRDPGRARLRSRRPRHLARRARAPYRPGISKWGMTHRCR
jgi:hypothetical protein